MKPRVHVFMDTSARPDHVPADALTVRDVEEHLADYFGGHWVGWHRGDAVPNAALWAQLDELGGRWRMTGVALMGEAIRAEDLRKVPIAAIENSVNLGVKSSGKLAEDAAREELAKLPPLRRDPDISPEDWSARVAAHYRVWAQVVPNPGAAMATEWSTNRQTVGAWIREARLRGLLPPARAKKPVPKKPAAKMQAAKTSTKKSGGAGALSPEDFERLAAELVTRFHGSVPAENLVRMFQDRGIDVRLDGGEAIVYQVKGSFTFPLSEPLSAEDVAELLERAKG